MSTHAIQVAPGLDGGFARRTASARSRARSRALARVRNPIAPGPGNLGAVPTKRRPGWIAATVPYAVAALAIHAAVVFGLLLGSAGNAERRPAPVERVVIRAVDASEWPGERPSPPVEEVAQEISAPAPEPTAPLSPSPKKTRPDRTPKPAADPIDTDSAPPTEPKAQPRRVVGISMESTVSSGAGPAFAVGNTRMGVTDTRAADPTSVEKLGPSAAVSRAGSPSSPNTAATALPGDVSFEKPRRIGAVRLEYPDALKARGIDGDVVVLIRITAQGNVSTVKVLKSSGYPELDEAAQKAATNERYEPATRGGEPVEYSLKYTYRFRIKEA